ncbi:MAG: AGE family epimerase/isomerase [Pirellulales bacterium]
MVQMVVCDASQTDHKRIALAEKLRHALGPQLLEIWYPLAVDSAHGVYLSDFSYNWKPDGKQEKMIVTQARHVWTASKASQFFAKGESYEQVAAHGVTFLRDVMWDRTHGGFFNLVDREGQVLLNSDGGTTSAGAITWDLGTIAAGASGSVTTMSPSSQRWNSRRGPTSLPIPRF